MTSLAEQTFDELGGPFSVLAVQEPQGRVETGRLQVLGIARELLRRTAPARPHPVVARSPPGNALAALPLSVLDRTRDALDAAAARVPAVRDRAVALSATLAAVAGRVECWGPWRRRARGHPPRLRASSTVSGPLTG